MSTGLEDAEFYGEIMDQQAKDKQAKREMKEFLRKLSALSKQTGIHIGGCGCCGSPFLVQGRAVVDDLRWDDKAKKYTIN